MSYKDKEVSDIEILKEMLKEEVIVSLTENKYNDKRQVILEEPGADYFVEIHGMPSNDEVVVIKADSFKAPKDIFRNSKHECKRADFIIIIQTQITKIILYIEMKSGKGHGEHEIIQQLKGAQCFIAYCQEVVRLFWKKDNFLKDYKNRFVSIRNINVSKRSTITRAPKIHDCPEKMLKISSPKYIELNKLI